MSNNTNSETTPPSLDNDSYKNNSDTSEPIAWCGNASFRREIVLDGVPHWEYVPYRCSQWSCEACRKRLRQSLSDAIAREIKAVPLSCSQVLTLDYKSLKLTPETSVAYIKDRWRSLKVAIARFIRRRYGKSARLSFVTVVEVTKRGIAHLHVLLNHWIPQRWLSKRWSCLEGGRIVYARRTGSPSKASWYLTKNVGSTPVPKYARRYSSSRDITLFSKKPTKGWALLDDSLCHLHSEAGDAVVQEDWRRNGELRRFVAKV